jgi:hypothetical protein
MNILHREEAALVKTTRKSGQSSHYRKAGLTS